MHRTLLGIIVLFLLPVPVVAQQPGNAEGDARTVIGPTNVDLADGAAARPE